MAQDYDRTVQGLLSWGICEKNRDGELVPTAHFLIQYYNYLIYEIAETWGGEWLETYTGEEQTKEQIEEEEQRDEERKELVLDCMRNEIVQWTSQTIGKTTYAETDVDTHVKIISDLIIDIDASMAETRRIKSTRIKHSSDRPAPEFVRKLDEENDRQWKEFTDKIMGKEIEAQRIERERQEEEKRKQEERDQRKIDDFGFKP